MSRWNLLQTAVCIVQRRRKPWKATSVLSNVIWIIDNWIAHRHVATRCRMSIFVTLLFKPSLRVFRNRLTALIVRAIERLLCLFFFFYWRYNPSWFCILQPSSGAIASSRTRFLDAPQSVGLLWTSDPSVAETSIWQHTTLRTDKHPCLCGIRTHDLSRRAAVDLRLRSRGYWDRLVVSVTNSKYVVLNLGLIRAVLLWRR